MKVLTRAFSDIEHISPHGHGLSKVGTGYYDELLERAHTLSSLSFDRRHASRGSWRSQNVKIMTVIPRIPATPSHEYPKCFISGSADGLDERIARGDCNARLES